MPQDRWRSPRRRRGFPSDDPLRSDGRAGLQGPRSYPPRESFQERRVSVPISRIPQEHSVRTALINRGAMASVGPEDMWWTVVKEAATNWSSHKYARQDAALAYYSVFSLGTIIVIAIAVADLLFGHEAVTSQVMLSIKEMLGETGVRAVEAMLAGASRPAIGILANVLGLGALLFAAIGVVVQLKDALNVVWEVDKFEKTGLWHFARTYVLSFASGTRLSASDLARRERGPDRRWQICRHLPADGSTSRRQHTDFVRRRDGTLRDDVQMATRCVRRLARRLAGRIPHGAVLRGWEGGHRLLHREARTRIDLWRDSLDRCRADLGLLHVADHPEGRRGHPQLRKPQRLFEMARLGGRVLGKGGKLRSPSGRSRSRE